MLVKKGYNKFRGSLVNTNSQYDYKPHAATVHRQKTEAGMTYSVEIPPEDDESDKSYNETYWHQTRPGQHITNHVS